MTDNRIRNAGRLILFGILFLVLLTLFSAALNPTKWFDDKRIQDRNARITQMMEQRPDSIDILNLGDSLSQSAYTPMELWRQKGYTSFNVGMDGLLMPEAYYALKEACEDQKPRYLLMEALPLCRLPENMDMQILISQPLYHRFAFLKYHSLWKTFVEGKGVRIYHKGYLINRIEDAYTGDLNYLDGEVHDDWATEVPKDNQKWFEKIRKLCDEQDIRIILYAMPSPKNYTWERVNGLQAFADEEGIEFIDLNSRYDEVGIDWSLDTGDRGDHLNLNGATKVAEFFGDRLSEYGNLTDHRQDPAYKSWEDELVEYDKLVDEMEGISFYNVQRKRDEERRKGK